MQNKMKINSLTAFCVGVIPLQFIVGYLANIFYGNQQPSMVFIFKMLRFLFFYDILNRGSVKVSLILKELFELQ